MISFVCTHMHMRAATSTVHTFITGLIGKRCCTGYMIFRNFQKDKPVPEPSVVEEVPGI